MKSAYVRALIGAAALAFAAPLCARPVWAIDIVKVKPGERDRYVSFVKQNWAVNRQEAMRRKAILSYRMVIADQGPGVAAAAPDVLLMTEYPSEQAYADREKIFEPIMKVRQRVLIDGKSGRDFVESMVSFSATSE